MYKLVIADDELFIRESLSMLVDWEKLGFELMEVFSDGQELLDYVDYMPVDVIFTDIKMGYVSGVEIAKYVYENRLPCKVLFISGYQEFDLAMEAMKYGVSGYLLKPANVEMIEEKFLEIKNELDKEETRIKDEEERQKRLIEVLPIIKEKFFSDLVLGVVGNRKQICSRMELLYPQLNIESSPCVLVDISIVDYPQFIEQVWKYSSDRLEEDITAFVNNRESPLSMNIIYKSNELIELFGVLIEPERNDSSRCVEELEKFVTDFVKTFSCEVKYQIRKTFKNIFEVTEYRENTLLKEMSSDMKYLHEQKKLIMSDVSNHNITSAQKVFHNIVKEVYKANFLWKNEFVVDVISVMGEVVKKINPNLEQEIHSYVNYSALIAMNSEEQVREYCDRIFDKMRTEIGVQKGVDNNTLVYNAQQYIQTHIMEDISQEQVANELYISSAYLCRIFKKHTNENFSQYITRMKMEKAVDLLKDVRYKTYQVAEDLGYKTPKYFSKLFKQHTGMSPSEYRSRVLNLEGLGDETT